MPNDTFPGDMTEHANGAIQAEAAGLQDTARKLGSQAADLGEQVYRQAVEAGKYADRTAREQPWLLAAGTALLGVVAGLLLAQASMRQQPRTTRDYVDDYLPKTLRRR